MIEGGTKRLRLAIIGSCQVAGLAAAARRFLPNADIRSWHVGVPAPPIGDTDEALLAHLGGFDFIISQLSDWDSHVLLRISRLRELGLPVVYLPTFVFAGFHPDSTYVIGPGGLVRGAGSDYHSIIIAASFQLGIPAERVPSLFNAYVFAELGYFDVFEASKTALIANFEREDFDLRPHFDQWITQAGQFMHTINHPHITVLVDLMRLALIKANLISPDMIISRDIEDYLATHLIFPTYPALARRIGIPGSNTIVRAQGRLNHNQARECSMADFVNENYLYYNKIQYNFSSVSAINSSKSKISNIWK
jgi:hypothetical protein